MATKSATAKQRKKEAMELASLIYDVFKESKTNGNVSGEQEKAAPTDEKQS